MTSGCIGALTVGLAGALVCFLSGADDKEKAALDRDEARKRGQGFSESPQKDAQQRHSPSARELRRDHALWSAQIERVGEGGEKAALRRLAQVAGDAQLVRGCFSFPHEARVI